MAAERSDPGPSAPPGVSVIVPAYNAGAHIRAALESIAAQRDAPAIEVIVVDDGSTDDTGEQVDAFARTAAGAVTVRLIAQANAGPSAARNRGIQASRADLIALLDADDLWPPERLHIQLALLAQHPQAGLVFGDCRGFAHDGQNPRTQFEEQGLDDAFWGGPVLVQDPYAKLIAVNYVPTGAVLARKDCLLAAGGFDESRRLVEDMDLWLRLALHGPFAYTRAVCQLKRTHAGNVSADAEAMTLAFIDVLQTQARQFPQELRRRGLRIAPRVAFEYALVGDQRERRGDRAGARRAYLAALRAHPSLRPAYYWARTWLP
jgi:glycosyltransferase involved in cell wall biosynthesis